VSVGPGRAAPIGELFAHAGATQAVVRIERETWTSGPARIHLDQVEGLGRLVHFDVDVLEAGGVDPARRAVLELAGAFGVTAADEVPWSYAELRAMYQAASGWRARLARARRRGTLFVLDGASGSGKSTLARNLAADADLNLHLARRYSTRRRRAGDSRAEYVFVSRRAFAKAAISGRLIEYRHYRFGMSYGLPWHGAVTPLLGGRDSLGIVSLGSVAHVKRVFPEAVAVLVDAPIETIRRRLIRRGLNNQEEIDERLGNAAATEHFREHYDHIVMNDDGMLEQAEASLKEFIASRSRADGSNS
jgi:guanylate kinase